MNTSILQDSGLSQVTIGAGTVLVEEGVPSGNVYVLVSGKVVVTARGQVLATMDAPGTILGQLALLLHTNPSASMATVEASTFFVIPNFMEFIIKHPEVCVNVAQSLASRLATAINQLVYVKEQIAALQEGLQGYVAVLPEDFQA